MLNRALNYFRASLSDIYNLRDENAKGRLISLGSALITALYNVFITGVFYTGFLTMYDMSIEDVGIISYIPLIGNCFCIFSSMILERFKKRKAILIASKIFFYAMYIIATTMMPLFVHDTGARVLWFAIILFVAHAVYALFSTGFTPWFYAFYPQDNEKRTRYLTLNQIFSSIMSSATLLFSSFITDALAETPFADTIIIILRYVAFALVLVDVAMQACAVEHPYPKADKPNLIQIFTLPFKYKKFTACLIMMFAWNFIANVPALWNYHLLENLDFSYTLINAMSVMYTVILVLTSGIWRKILRRYSWMKTFAIAVLLWLPTEPLFFFMTKDTSFLYVPLCTIQNILSVGLNLSYANILYMNLPEKNSTTHIAFFTIGCNFFAFLGQLVGAFVSGIGGDTPFILFGMEMYTVQYNTLIRFVLMGILGAVCFFGWRMFTPDRDIKDIDDEKEFDRKLKEESQKLRERMIAERAAKKADEESEAAKAEAAEADDAKPVVSDDAHDHLSEETEDLLSVHMKA